MGATYDFFKWVILIQAFFGISVTTLLHILPADTLAQISQYSTVAGSNSLDSVSSKVQSSLTQQTNIPIINVGAILFYSGNIILDLLLNFTLAIPAMVVLIIHAITYFIGIDSFMTTTVIMFAQTIIAITYYLGIIELLTGIRSGRVV